MRDTSELQLLEKESVNPNVLAMREKFIEVMHVLPQEAKKIEEFKLDQDLFAGFQEGTQEMNDEKEATSFLALIKELQDVSESTESQVNTQESKVEMNLIGFLLGRKVAKKDAHYVPPGIDTYHTLPLRSLHRISVRAYSTFKEDKKENFMTQMSRYFSRLRSS